MSEVVERNAKGQLLPGNQVGFTKDRQPLTNGRIWRDPITLNGIQIVLPKVIADAMALIESPNTPADVKLDTMKWMVDVGFGKPSVATLVRYEVDLIIKAYDLPKRSQLRDKDGNRLFGKFGSFISAAKRQELAAFKNASRAEREEMALKAQGRFPEEIEEDAQAKLSPASVVYQAPLRPKAEAQKIYNAAISRFDLMAREYRLALDDLAEMRDGMKDASDELRHMMKLIKKMPDDPEIPEPPAIAPDPSPVPEPRDAATELDPASLGPQETGQGPVPAAMEPPLPDKGLGVAPTGQEPMPKPIPTVWDQRMERWKALAG